MKKLIFLFILTIFASCGILNKKKTQNTDANYFPLEPIEIIGNQKTTEYRESKTKHFELIHTKLNVSFDWEKCRLNGEATLTLKPYFYSTKKIVVDAKGFDIEKITAKYSNSNDIFSPVPYFTYDSLQLHITLEKELTSKDTCCLFIKYVAKPNEFISGGSKAIRSDKGLYFINPSGKENKPQQIWTQGETESNSRWFPTLDGPNFKTTQEVYITVDTSFVTLSNGTLIYSVNNNNGTKTDYWKQDKPHAPYLVMMAIGQYTIIEDEWTKKDGTKMPVNYYMEPKFAPYAKNIFGNTPEMLTYYSNLLGVEYPWDKYHQIIVRDYVSGAMENTSAVIFGEFMNQTDRELLDNTYESVVAHELFHHWFGDLVTTESWANLPLNESFANYGQYLWDENKYGKDEADYNLHQNLNDYLNESKSKQESLVRYYYSEKEEMFDRHSYEKGGCVLHMLRKYVGDEAFFKSLNKYLTENAYQSAEIHQLRLAFEKVTGEDLNWFFNQWFFTSGHPIINISYKYDSINKIQYIYTEQRSSSQENFLYKIPVMVDLYFNDNVTSEKIILKNTLDTFAISTNEKPLFVNFDQQKMLLCEKTEVKNAQEWFYQYEKSPLFLDRFEALVQLVYKFSKHDYETAIVEGLYDNHWSIRQLCVFLTDKLDKTKDIQEKLVKLSFGDKDSKVRAASVLMLQELYLDSLSVNYFKSLLDDPSYEVISEALYGLYKLDNNEGIKTASLFEKDENTSITNEILRIYTQEGLPDKNSYFIHKINSSANYQKASYIMSYQRYLMNDSVIKIHFDEGLKIFEQELLSEENNDIKLYSVIALKYTQDYIKVKLNNATISEKSFFEEKQRKFNETYTKIKNNLKDKDLLIYFNEDIH